MHPPAHFKPSRQVSLCSPLRQAVVKFQPSLQFSQNSADSSDLEQCCYCLRTFPLNDLITHAQNCDQKTISSSQVCYAAEIKIVLQGRSQKKYHAMVKIREKITMKAMPMFKLFAYRHLTAFYFPRKKLEKLLND